MQNGIAARICDLPDEALLREAVHSIFSGIITCQAPQPHLICGEGQRGNINTAALVTIAQYNTLVARCSSQLIGPAGWVFVTLGPLRCD